MFAGPLWRNTVTLPPPDMQSQRSLSANPRTVSGTHLIPASFSLPMAPSSPSSSLTRTDPTCTQAVSSADFSLSWDLATGGLKTLTAKRELPPRQERRIPPAPSSESTATRSSMFLLVILACIVVMLISGGVVLFMTLQP